MDDIIVIGIICLILGLAAWYVIRSKKKGSKCIGCPSNGDCQKKNCGNCGCCSDKA